MSVHLQTRYQNGIIKYFTVMPFELNTNLQPLKYYILSAFYSKNLVTAVIILEHFYSVVSLHLESCAYYRIFLEKQFNCWIL